MKYYGDSELIRRSVFNAAGSFGKVGQGGETVPTALVSRVFRSCATHQALLQGSIFPRVGQAVTCGYGCGDGDEGSCGGVVPCQVSRMVPLTPKLMCFWLSALVAPYCAILRYYRCDTPYRAILFKGGPHFPKMVRYPPLVLGVTQAHLCDTPFCNVSRDNCAIPHQNKHERVLRYHRYKYRAI